MKKIFILLAVLFIYLAANKLIMAQEKEETNSLKNTAFIIIDIQNFYFPGGSLPLFEPEKAAQNAQELLKICRQNDILVIHVRHNASSGSEIHSLVKPIEGEKIISKDKANSFVGTDLLEYLNENNIKNLIICGMQTHMCLEAATRAASDYGFSCTVIEDACTTRDLKFGDNLVLAKDVHYSTLSTLNKTYAEIKTTKEILNEIKNQE